MRPVSLAAVFAAMMAAIIPTSCGDAAPEKPADPTADPSYRRNVEQLAAMDRDAENFFRNGKPDDAAAKIQAAEPIASDVLAVPRPTLAAMEAASDLDDLYGRMLLSNRHYEWAQFQFQKNLARWKYWKPQTPDAERRMKEAESAIAECDKGMMKGGAPRKSAKSGGRSPASSRDETHIRPAASELH